MLDACDANSSFGRTLKYKIATRSIMKSEINTCREVYQQPGTTSCRDQIRRCFCPASAPQVLTYYTQSLLSSMVASVICLECKDMIYPMELPFPSCTALQLHTDMLQGLRNSTIISSFYHHSPSTSF